MPLQQLENLYDKYCSAYNSGNVKQLFFEGTTLRQPMITHRVKQFRSGTTSVRNIKRYLLSKTSRLICLSIRLDSVSLAL